MKVLGLDTLEYQCKKCGCDFEISWPDIADAVKLREMSCPIVSCRGAVELLDADEEIPETEIARITEKPLSEVNR